MNNPQIKKYIVGILILNLILFFLPWFSMNMESGVLNYDTLISGSKLSGYGETLKGLTVFLGEGMKRNLADIALLGLRFLLLIPVLLGIGAIMNIYNIRFARLVTNLAFGLVIFVAIIVFLMMFANGDLRDFINSLFVMTPTIYIMFFSSILGILLACLKSGKKLI